MSLDSEQDRIKCYILRDFWEIVCVRHPDFEAMYLRLLRLEAASRDGDAHARDQWTRSAVARGTLCSNTGASYQTSAGAGSGLALRAAHDAPPGTRVMLTASAAETAAGRSGGGNGGKAPTSHHDTQSLPPNVIATVETPAHWTSPGGAGAQAESHADLVAELGERDRPCTRCRSKMLGLA